MVQKSEDTKCGECHFWMALWGFSCSGKPRQEFNGYCLLSNERTTRETECGIKLYPREGERMGKVDKETIRIAAEAGAKAAMDRLDKERAKDREERVDRRLYNTKLLLQNYRLFRKHAENAVFEAEQLEESVYDILDMMERNTGVGFVDSIKNSVARTALLVRHIEVMLGLYQTYCEGSSKPEDARRWRVIKARYIDENEKSVLDLADQEYVVDRTIRRDIEEACEHLAALFFGIDGVKRG